MEGRWQNSCLGTANSTSLSTGAVVISVGLGVNDNIAAASASLQNSTTSTSTATGALTVSGSARMAGSVFVGGNFSVASGRVTHNVTFASATYTVQQTDYIISCNTSSGAFTVTLPSATGATGRTYLFTMISTNRNTLTIAAASCELINSKSTIILIGDYSCVTWTSIGLGAWIVVKLTETIPTVSFRGIGLSPDVNSGVTLTTGGWRIICSGTLTLNGVISANGGNATRTTGGTYEITAGATFLGPGTVGGAGRTTAGNGTAGTNTVTYVCLGGVGGAGGGTTEGAGGTIISIPAVDGGPYIFSQMPTALQGRFHLIDTNPDSITDCYIQGGSGGGSGYAALGLSTSISTGAGGRGRGVAIVCANVINGSGSMTANGGRGSSTTYTGSTTGLSCGGGGGGGGGAAIVIYKGISSSITITANGGSAGTSVGSASAPTAGAARYVFMVWA
ncbi:hypothetical protein BDK51DRAFT_42173 [Blyttiomyces helicus]|uniref:Uncharacterized protein n=1 Tax=Blyttiomyces helicus TaxID=388810 RepID=A0A4P9WQE2_9FUNG|nr:hypothetical protein BDK51DRAFT_42173 [Blyttiomyces helicus]|eukprot:RKO94383.1 hypothetical protein BDK51DRAFT_42173 [Blyttiomyces helicus]